MLGGELSPHWVINDDGAARAEHPRRVWDIGRNNGGASGLEPVLMTIDDEDDLAADNVPHLLLDVMVVM